MTVSSSSAWSGPYLTNGTTTDFPFDFKAFSAAGVAVVMRTQAGNEFLISPNAYTVTLADQSSTVSFATPPVAGSKLFIKSAPNGTQDIGFERGAPYLPGPVNEANDRSAVRDLALARDLARTFAMPLGETGYNVPGPRTRAGKVLGFDPDTGAAGLVDILALLASFGPVINQTAYDGINLLAPGVAGVSQVRNDGTDPDASNSSKINAVLQHAALNNIPVYVPRNASIGCGAQIVLPHGLAMFCQEGSEFIHLNPTGGTGMRLFSTDSVANPNGVSVYLDGLAWRCPNGGRGLGGVFRDSYIRRPHHKSSGGIGIAIAWELYNTVVDQPVVENMPSEYGCGGIRTLGAIDSVVNNPRVHSGDDALQMVVGAGVLNKRFERFFYVGPGYGISDRARGAIGGSAGSANAIVKDAGFIGKLFLMGGGWPLRVNAASHFAYPVKGSRSGGIARMAFSATVRRGNRPIQVTENVTFSSVSDPSWNGTMTIDSAGTVAVKTTLTFNTAAKTITAASGTPFTNMLDGEYIFVWLPNLVTGPNDGFTAKIVSHTGNVLTLDTAPFADETSSIYTINDTVNFVGSFAGAAGPAPSDLMVRRTFPGYVDGFTVDALLDDSTGIRGSAATVNGDVRNLDMTVKIKNLRKLALTVKDGSALNANNNIRIKWDAPPTTDGGDACVSINATNGLNLEVDGYPYPTQPGMRLRAVTEYDEDDPDVILSQVAPTNVTVSGSIRGLAAGQVGIIVGQNVTDVRVKDYTPEALAGVTNAVGVRVGSGGTCIVESSDFSNISPGNTASQMVTIDSGGAATILSGNVGLPSNFTTKVDASGGTATNLTLAGTTTATGSIILAGLPLAANEAATKSYVDQVGIYTGSGGVTLSAKDFRLSQVPALTLKGNNTAFTTSPTDLTVTQTRSLLALGGYENDAWLATATKRPMSSRRSAYGDYIQTLINEGLWAKLGVLAILCTSDKPLTLHNVPDPSKVFVENGTIPWVSERGYTSDGTTGYVDTMIPVSAMPTVSLNSTCLIVSTGTSVASNSVYDASLGVNVRINSRNSTGPTTARINSTNDLASASLPTGIGTFAVNRTSSTNTALYMNGVSIASSTTDTSTSLSSTATLQIGRSPNSGYSPRQIAMAAVFGGLTDAEVLIEYNARKALFQTIGVAV